MKIRLAAALLLVMAACTPKAADVPVLTPQEQIAADPYKAGGVYFRGKGYSYANLDGKTAAGNELRPLTPAPKGYKPFHISHYGRHGARYIIDPKTNDRSVNPMRAALADSALTPYGVSLAERMLAHYATSQHREGDLTRLGWRQHQDFAREMYREYPAIFKHDPKIEAYATQVQRCIMSMDAFCTALTAIDPHLDIYQETSRINLDNLNPHANENPLRQGGTAVAGRYTRVNPWGGTWPQFIDSILDYKAILARIFKDPDWIATYREPRWFVASDLFNFVLNAQDSDSGVDMMDVFTPEELYKVWQSDNYMYWMENGPVNDRDLPLVENYVKFVDEALGNYASDGRPSVFLRFGHDSALLYFLTCLDVDGMGQMPSSAAEIENIWQNYRVPMGATLNTVFYCPVHGKYFADDVLVKMTLCGEEVKLASVPGEGPYYRWSDVRNHLTEVIESYN